MPDGFRLDEKPAELADVAGFRTGIATCGLKRSGRPDVGVILCVPDAGCGTAVFTRNAVAAAPVRLSRPRALAGRLRAVVANSGNANCCTGERGERDAAQTAALAAEALGVPEERVLVASTGVIGRPLDMEKVRAGVTEACALALDGGRGDLAAAILTTDTVRKVASASGTLAGRPFRVAGTAKGAGMIAPDLGPPAATMLAFVVTDAAAEPAALRAILPGAAERTFNRVTVDGDTSTNDTLCLMASGLAGNTPVADPGSPGGAVLAGAVEAVARELAVAIAADGEGATRLVEVRVTGAASDRDADLAARAVANSPLVKTAAHGADPNWGRVLAAAGRSGAKVDERLATVRLQGSAVFERGGPIEPVPQALGAKLREKRIAIELDLGLGAASAEMWTCDLTRGYIEINAEYHT